VFDAVDSFHLMQNNISDALPSSALQEYSRLLINFLCNVYDDDEADDAAGTLCCASQRPHPQRPVLFPSARRL